MLHGPQAVHALQSDLHEEEIEAISESVRGRILNQEFIFIKAKALNIPLLVFTA